MTVIDAMIKDLPVTGTSYWAKGGHERTYLQLDGYDASYRGCKTDQVYWDHKACKLVAKMGKGTTTRAYDASRSAVIDAFAQGGAWA